MLCLPYIVLKLSYDFPKLIDIYLRPLVLAMRFSVLLIINKIMIEQVINFSHIRSYTQQ